MEPSPVCAVLGQQPALVRGGIFLTHLVFCEINMEYYSLFQFKKRMHISEPSTPEEESLTNVLFVGQNSESHIP